MRVVLTGSGVNPTLNATLGNANDNGGTTITPKLIGIETINVAFTGSGGTVGAVNELDLQDSPNTGNTINITRISDGIAATATIDNIGVASKNLSVSHSGQPNQNVSFVYKNSVLSGKEDETTLTLRDVQLGTLRVEGRIDTGFETINLVSEESANRVATLNAEDLETLNITGDQNLWINSLGNTAGSLSLIDGSAATGNLDLNLDGVLSATQDGTSGTNIALTVKTGTGDDVIRVTDDTIGETDRIDTGAGNDTLMLRATNNRNFTPNTMTEVVTGVENVQVTRIADLGPSPLTGLGAPDAPANLMVNLASIAGDQNVGLLNDSEEGLVGGAVTFTLANASAGDATGVSIRHSSTSNNDLNQNIIVLDVIDGVTTAGVEIVEGVNDDPRFNFQLQADSNLVFNGAGAIQSGANDVTNSVVNINIADNDSESNSVHLIDAAAHTGTLTVTGGAAGTFLNLDTTAAGVGGYGYNVTGADGSATTVVAALPAANPAIAAAILAGDPFVQPSARDNVVSSVLNTTAGQELVFSNIAAATQASDLIVRLGLSNTNTQLGSGNDTVIFADRAGITAATSGLTIQDTVAGGAGTDTIVLDGTGVQTLGASEWTNLTGIDVIRLAGVAGSTYNLRLTDQLVTQTDAGNRITIINNDGDLRGVAENAATINLRALAASNHVTFIGANGDGALAQAGRAAQTVILNDVTANGENILNGGDKDVVTDYTSVGVGRLFANAAAADAAWGANLLAGIEGNNNVLQIFNNAEVTIGDLANTKNFSTINFVNDQASVQTLNLTLDNATVDRLVDASHTATATQRETLIITATDNTVLPTATANLNVQAGTVGAQFNLNVTGGGGTDIIVAGAGDDIITGGAGADVIDVGSGDDTIIITAAGDSGPGAAALAAAQVTATMDIVTGMGNGDIIDLSGVGSAALNALVALGATGAAALGADDTIHVTQGTYAAVAGVMTFTAGAGVGDLDAMIVYDTANGAPVSLDAIVLVGAWNAVADGVTVAGGVITL